MFLTFSIELLFGLEFLTSDEWKGKLGTRELMCQSNFALRLAVNEIIAIKKISTNQKYHIIFMFVTMVSMHAAVLNLGPLGYFEWPSLAAGLNTIATEPPRTVEAFKLF